MNKSVRTGTCSNCGCGFWAFNKRGPVPSECAKCTIERTRFLGKQRASKRRKSKTTPPDNESRGGGSISESDLTLPRSKQRVKSKPIRRVAEGREGLGNQPLPYQELPPLETLKTYNEKLYEDVLLQLREIARNIENPRIVITGVKNNE